ncbi:SDR family NAD(P)-dependent oxidoreductase [Actinopolymorpha sp. NPDC004070]|uniref:SDR family NAD(P)-dependent oxidoreductase n=1 Tax=Actinopolymorpha sp. NPDC004070 TaxID=3154548 RepID=UPI0033ADB7EE
MNHNDNKSTHPGDRVVVLTGAGTGIGRATAREFAAMGAHVVAVGRRPRRCGRPPPTVHASGLSSPTSPPTRPRTGSCTKPSRPTAGSTCWSTTPTIVGSGSLGSFTPTSIGPQLATNLVAPILLTQAALPALETAGGVVVNVSTSIGRRAWPGNSVHAATKTALELLTRSWAVELAPRGVRVVVLDERIAAQTRARDRLAAALRRVR